MRCHSAASQPDDFNYGAALCLLHGLVASHLRDIRDCRSRRFLVNFVELG